MGKAAQATGTLTRRDEIYAVHLCLRGREGRPNAEHPRDSRRSSLAYLTVYHHIMKLIIEGRLRQQDGKLIVVGSGTGRTCGAAVEGRE